MNERLTVIDRLRARAASTPDEVLYTFVDDGGADAGTLTWRATLDAASIVAALLAAQGLGPGDRAVLVYSPSLDFVSAFIGCLLARVVPVPVAPPNPYNLERELPALEGIAASARARVVLTDAIFAGMQGFARGYATLASLPWVSTSALPASTASGVSRPVELPLPRPEDVAFIQYTSGSTSAPRGVLITFGNLEHQLATNARELAFGPDARLVMWVPHFHDFGLVSGILSALHGNGRVWMMSPLSFVRRPQLWFEVMHRVRATHTAAPNFAYDLVVRKSTPEQRRGWDLSSLRVVMSAAEPIRPATVDAFLEAFAVSRLDPNAYCPAYGLAEHTVGVSVRGRARLVLDRAVLEREGRVAPATEGDDRATWIGCGKPSDGVDVRIVDPETKTPRGAGLVGEIWVTSASKAKGYDGLPDESRAVFEATLAGSDDGARFLRTGDLGFLHEGELFVVGRLKDTIIARGRNLHPQDIEEAARACHDLVRPGGIAAFPVAGPAELGDGLALLVELCTTVSDRSALHAVVAAVRAAVLRGHGVAAEVVILAEAGAILKTSSGKLRRRAIRQAFERGELNAIHVARELPRRTLADAVQGLDDDFRALASNVARWFAKTARDRAGRVFHKQATTLGGWIEGCDASDTAPFFAPGRRYPVLVRHANGVQDDDAAWDNRGATVRVLDLERAGELDASLLDLLLTTGPCFLAPTAQAFARWMASSPEQREAIARAEPHIAEAAWGMFRAPASYTEVHYFSKTASEIVDASTAGKGPARLARFRLRRHDVPVDGAFVRGDSLLPPDHIPRREGDTRPVNFLHEELRGRVEGGGVEYVLEMQTRARDAAALDGTRPWAEDAHPWRAVGKVHLDRVIEEGVDRLRFNSVNAPAELAPPAARSASDPASLEQLRQIVYEIAACARLGEALPPALGALMEGARGGGAGRAEGASSPGSSGSSGSMRARHRVCVIGAGASGLSAAFHLERAGHEVTVLEASAEVAGKCVSVDVDGQAYDLGGHLCMPTYRSFARLVSAVGATIEEATPTFEYDIAERRVLPWSDGPELRDAFLKYRGLRERELADLDRPGFAGVASRLAQPTLAWLATNGLEPLAKAIGGSYTSTGYGYLRDPSIPALYFVKAAETAGLLAKDGDPALPPYWTVKGGMGALWSRVAASLKDVRLGVRVGAVERRDGRVLVSAAIAGKRERLTFDRVVLALPLTEAVRFLDATLEERELFGEIRTLDYYTVVARVTGLPEQGFYILKQNTDDPARVGRTVAFHHRYPGSNIVSFYAYGDATTGEAAIERAVREDVEALGGHVERVELVRKWSYFPHVDPAAIEAGFYDRLEALQGRNQTYYAGSLLNFELIECNVRYVEALVDRHFGDGAEVAPSARQDRSTRSSAEILGWLVAAMREAGKPIAPETSIEELGLDSLAVTSFVTRLSDYVGVLVPTSLVYEHRTLARIADALGRHAEGRAPERSAPTVAHVAPPLARTTGTRTALQIGGGRDLGPVRAYWREHFGVGPWPFEDVLFAFIERFVNELVFEDAPAFEAVRDRGCVYLANHQVASEPALLSTLMAGLTGKRVVGLAKIEGRDGDLGWFMEHMFSYPGVTHPRTYVYLDRSKPEELGQRVSELAASLSAREANVLIHVQGTRGTTCREPVRMINPMFIEMAIATGAPIVPIRFVGGLPVEPLTVKLDVPVGYARQDYLIGKPILPEELSDLGFGARAERVLAAMNGVGPSNEIEQPGPPDPVFGGIVEDWMARTDAIPIWAIQYALLSKVASPCEGTQRILEGAKAGRLVLGSTPVDLWLAAYARRLFGARGPAVEVR